MWLSGEAEYFVGWKRNKMSKHSGKMIIPWYQNFQESCVTRNPGVLVSSFSGLSGFFVGVSLGKIL